MILVLGGTTEGRELCAALDRSGVSNLQSMAGRTADPLLTASVRVGGFGGVDGLLRFITERRITTVVDATHPFAAGITRNAALACAAAGVRLLRVDRPGWRTHPHADRWSWVDSHAAAASTVVALGSLRVLLTVGRQHTLDYSPALDDRLVLARTAEPPLAPLPPAWRLVLARGPFPLVGERRLFAEHQIDCLVTKDSGGDATAAKLQVAEEVGATVVMIRRPAPPEGVVLLPDVATALALLSDG